MDIPRREDVVTPLVLERNARLYPGGLMATFEDGTRWTYAEANTVARRAANALHARGVRQGDQVGVLLPNGPETLAAWLGITSLGAAFVPINRSFKGAMLEHLLRKTEPALVVTQPGFAEVIEAVDGPATMDAAELASGADAPPPREREIELWDTHHIMLTGGTTGPSKAARCSHLHFHNLGLYGTTQRGLDENDVFLIDLPLFHTAALGMVGGCLSSRTPICVRTAPNMSRYWETVKETGATIALLLSSMVGFLLAREPSPAEQDHRLRFLITIPVGDDPDRILKRFNVAELVTAYGGTEASTMMTSPMGEPMTPNSCGVVIPGYQAHIVDEHDIPVPQGEVGELIVRHELPWAMCVEYVGDPEGTARAWRNGWFHTGDLFRQDEDGQYFFVDRSKDAVRRRGVNISCYEVERAVLSYPDIDEVACVAVPAAVGADDDVKVWVVPKEGASVDFGRLVRYLYDEVPHFMVPRYYELTDGLPKNPSMKVQKFVLREKGNSATTWDAEVDGKVRVTSRGLKPL